MHTILTFDFNVQNLDVPQELASFSYLFSQNLSFSVLMNFTKPWPIVPTDHQCW